MSNYNTADLWDEYASSLSHFNLDFNHFGSTEKFHGEIVTLKLYEDNSLVRKTLSENGQGKVLIVDGGGSTRCGLVGDKLASLAIENNWAGLIIYGCIRDSAQINNMQIGIKAIGTCPVKSIKKNVGVKNETLIINGVAIKPGHYVYADADGVLLSPSKL